MNRITAAFFAAALLMAASPYELNLSESAPLRGREICLRDLGKLQGSIPEKAKRVWEQKCVVYEGDDATYLSRTKLEIFLLRENIWPEKIHGNGIHLEQSSVMAVPMEEKPGTVTPWKKGEVRSVLFSMGDIDIFMDAAFIGLAPGGKIRVRLLHTGKDVLVAQNTEGLFIAENF